MRIFKGLFLTLLSIFIVYVIICLFASSTSYVERNIHIKASKKQISNEISNFKKWEKWSPWFNIDSTIETSFSGIEGKVNSTLAWKSLVSGSGSMEITEVSENKIKYNLAIINPWKSNSIGRFEFEEIDTLTKVTWSNSNYELSFLEKGIMMLLMDKMMGPDFERGLTNLSNLTFEVINEPILDSIINFKKDSTIDSDNI